MTETPQDERPTLLHASVVTRQRSQRHSLQRSVIYYLVTAIALVAIFLPANVAWYLLLLNACLLGIALALKLLATREHLVSRDAQRLALLADGLGEDVLAFDHTEVLKDANLKDDWKSVTLPEKYYTSSAAPGRARLAINIAESSFYSRSLFERHRQRLAIRIGVASCAIVVGVIVVLASWASPSRFLAVTAAATILLVLTDDLETAVSVSRGIAAFETLDRKLHEIIGNHGLDDERVFSTFGDYSVASAVAPPIPSDVYARNRYQLDSYWDERRSQYEKAAEEERDWYIRVPDGLGTSIRCFEHFGSLPSWLTAEDRKGLVAAILPAPGQAIPHDGIEFSAVAGMGDAPVTLALVRAGERVVVQYYLKFYRDTASASRELATLRSLGFLAADCLPRVIDDPRLTSKGIVATYSVSSTGNREFQPGDRALRTSAVSRALGTEMLGLTHRALSRCSNTLPQILHAGQAAVTVDAAEVAKRRSGDAPRGAIMDLRGSVWVRSGNSVRVDRSKPGLGTRSAEPAAGTTSSAAVEPTGWSDGETVVAFSDALPNHLLLLPREMLSTGSPTLILEFATEGVADESSRPLETHLGSTIGGNWLSSVVTSAYAEGLRAALDAGDAALCHGDLHLGNVLVADGTFRIIDLFSVGPDFVYTDVCRLQISCLITLLNALPSMRADLVRCVCELLAGVELPAGNAETIARWLVGLRGEFDSGRHHAGSEKAYLGSLLMEASQQAYYSVLSSRPVGPEWPALLDFLRRRVAYDPHEGGT